MGEALLRWGRGCCDGRDCCDGEGLRWVGRDCWDGERLLQWGRDCSVGGGPITVERMLWS